MPAVAWVPQADARAGEVARAALGRDRSARPPRRAARDAQRHRSRGVPDHLDGAPDTAGMAALATTTNSSTAKPVFDTLRLHALLEEGQDTRGNQREETVVPGCL